MRWPLDGGPEQYPVGPIIDGVNEGTVAAHLARGEKAANDIPAPAGLEIHPCHDATVAVVAYDPFQAGHYVDYDWWGEDGRYHRIRDTHMLDTPPVRVGVALTEDSVIGQVGSTGNSTGPHIHRVEWLDGYGDEYRVDPSEHSLKVESVEDAVDKQAIENALNSVWDVKTWLELTKPVLTLKKRRASAQSLLDAVIAIKVAVGLQ